VNIPRAIETSKWNTWLLNHEMYHILLGSSEHSTSIGITKSIMGSGYDPETSPKKPTFADEYTGTIFYGNFPPNTKISEVIKLDFTK